jgi:hypothetical protein
LYCLRSLPLRCLHRREGRLNSIWTYRPSTPIEVSECGRMSFFGDMHHFPENTIALLHQCALTTTIFFGVLAIARHHHLHFASFFLTSLVLLLPSFLGVFPLSVAMLGYPLLTHICPSCSIDRYHYCMDSKRALLGTSGSWIIDRFSFHHR